MANLSHGVSVKKEMWEKKQATMQEGQGRYTHAFSLMQTNVQSKHLPCGRRRNNMKYKNAGNKHTGSGA